MALDTIETDLQDTLVELTDLALQGKQLHWSLVGRGFKSLHEQLDEVVDTARAASDDVAERAVTLGNAPDGRALTIAKESPLADVPAGQVKDTDALAHIVAVLTTVIDRTHERIGRLDGVDLVTQPAHRHRGRTGEAAVDAARTAGLTSRLRDAGLRATGPRVEILAALEDLGGHRAAEEIHDLLTARGQRIPRSSVYNVLTSLADAGLAMRADAGPGAVLYEAGGRWHHHFVCRVCHRVFDVECVTGERPCLTPGTDVGLVDEAQVIFRGTCAECAAA